MSGVLGTGDGWYRNVGMDIMVDRGVLKSGITITVLLLRTRHMADGFMIEFMIGRV